MQKIDSLQGKANWEDWKHLMQIRLSGIPDAIEAINGKLEKPQEPSTTATVEEKNAYKKKLDKFNKTQSDVMLSLIHISEPTRLLSISYAVFCLKKKKKKKKTH